ncbi:MAG: valine--tRNA ligase [Bacteroidetes bacterium RIFCSPLOWO2_12_FULL_37_12]|nr:MAG: valine--tRNA ligase [Bacteroidetes bacterium RIFCSPLOWO2_12_FULL_37_12]
MVIEKTYTPDQVEQKWYRLWEEKKYFHSSPNPEKEPYCIVIPPPNVTGVLHMGHVLNNTIQDVLIRKARMEGKETCWVPGTDHASIATEAKVVSMLKEQGIEKKSLSREEFLKHTWAWTHKHGGIIVEQLKRLGVSCDWERSKFTLDKDLSDSVTKVFVELYKAGLIYRGFRMVNWDPSGKTAISDEEIYYKESVSSLYYIAYQVIGSDEFITIATTRPETILGDTALCVHPDDERYKNFIGKQVYVPLIKRKIPVIADEYVDMTFGTGCLKVTPAHDQNDYRLGIKHDLPFVNIFNEDATLSSEAILFTGMERFQARKTILKELKKNNQLQKTEKIKNNIGYSERTHAVIEPRLSLQWFLKMDTLAKPALDVVEKGQIKFHPEKFINLYRHWLENIHDWCISRQLWWGHRIPAWYCDCEECKDLIIVQSEKPEKCPRCHCTKHLRQDEDVLDTWFSSWLWPITVFNGINEPNNKEFLYYYPTNTLVTAPEILFFWVARMIMAGLHFKENIPFKNVYFTGIVRDKHGKKMSKSLGNSPEPIALINKYGADAVRTGMLLCSPAGNDLLYDEALIIQGRNFTNKIWNAFRLINGWKPDKEIPFNHSLALRWFESKLNQSIADSKTLFNDFKISEALMLIYKLTWDDFCSNFLEMIKPENTDSIDEQTYLKTVSYYKSILKLLHPFLPFITEELWQYLRYPEEENHIINANFPKEKEVDTYLLENTEMFFQLITTIRKLSGGRKKEKNSNDDILVISNALKPIIEPFSLYLSKLTGINQIKFNREAPTLSAISFFIKDKECFYINPVAQKNDDKEKENIAKEIAYLSGFLTSINNKLTNENFLHRAKADIIEKELLKKKDVEGKLRILEANLKNL